MKEKYYLIKKRLLGKTNSKGSFIYKNNKWEEDVNDIIRDHLFGYDPFDDSHYGIFNSDIMDDIEKITKKEAKKYMEENNNEFRN